MDSIENSSSDISEEETIHILFDDIFSRIKTISTGFIESIDTENKNFVNVQQTFKQVYNDINEKEKSQDRAVINHVPILSLRGNGFYIRMPIQKGQPVLLLFCERSIDNYLETDGKSTIEPGENRMFDENDCFAFPVMVTKKNNIPDDNPNDLVIAHENGNISIILKTNDEIDIKATKVNLQTSRLNIGSSSASTAVAKGSIADSNFDAIGTFQTQIAPYIAALALVAGSPAPVPPTLQHTSSGKAFTND